ncbi:MAG: lipopolysaccharide biosynthesis protein [Lysobacterales bacterium]
MSERSLTERATSAAWWSALEIGTRYGVQFGVTMALARLLTPADFGLMAMLLVFTTFAALLVEGGLGTALVQKQASTHDDETSVFLVNLVAGCVVALALWALAPEIARFYAQPTLAPLLQMLAWLLPLGALATVPNALLTQQLDFRRRTGAELLASVGSGGLALWLAWRGHGVWSLAWQALVGAALRAALLWWLSGWRPRGRYDRAAFAGLFRFGGYLLLANALSVGALRLQSLLLGRLFDARTLGVYAMAQDTQQAPAQLASALLNRVGLPMFASVADQPVKLAGALRLSLRLSMFAFAPCMMGLAVVAAPLVRLLYGPQWSDAAPLLSLLALATLFWPLHVLNLAALGALGRSDLILKLEVAKAAVTIPLVAMASPFGAQALAWVALVASVACTWINTRHAHHLLDCGLRVQLRDLRPILLLTLAASASAWLALALTGRSPWALCLAIAAAMATYAVGAVTLRLQAWQDLLDFLRTLRSDMAPAGGGMRA